MKIKKYSNKIVSLMIIIMMISLLVIGCKNSASVNGKEVTITFWNSFTGSDGDMLKSIVNDFNKEYAGKIKVNMDIMSSSVFTQKLPPAIATKTAPDLVTLSSIDLVSYAKNNSIEDLSDFFDKTGVDKNDFMPMSLKLGNIDNKQYGLPMQVFDSTNLFWNKDLFKAAGLDPDTPPKTFDELASYAKKLTDPSKNQYGFGMCASAAPQFYAVFIRGNGGSVVDLNAKKSVLDSDVNLKTFEYLHELAYTYKVTPKSTNGVEMDNLMQSGKIAMYIDGPWLVPGLKSHNINFGVADVPSGLKGKSGVLDGTLFAIPVGIDNSHKAAVYTFLKYWNSTSVGRQWSLNDGMPPYLKSVANDPSIKANQTISVFTNNLMNSASPWNFGLKSASKIDNDVLFPLIEKLQNECNVEQVVKAASEQINNILQNEEK